jgi:hypothetical protein
MVRSIDPIARYGVKRPFKDLMCAEDAELMSEE